jgi:hypothetical protein
MGVDDVPTVELFDYCAATKIEHRLSLLLSMSLILICETHPPSVGS